jgi:hypothetical protein
VSRGAAGTHRVGENAIGVIICRSAGRGGVTLGRHISPDQLTLGSWGRHRVSRGAAGTHAEGENTIGVII